MDIPSYLLGKQAGGGGGTTDTPITVIKNNSVENPFILSEHEPGVYLFEDLTLYGLGAYLIYCKVTPEQEYTGNFALSPNAPYFYYPDKITSIPDSTTIVGYTGSTVYNANGELAIQTVYVTNNGGMGIDLIGGFGIDLDMVTKGTAQTITAKKTFSTLPESSAVPTTDEQLVNKKYVDDNAGKSSVILIEDNSSANPFIFDEHEPGIYIFKYANYNNNNKAQHPIYLKGSSSDSGNLNMTIYANDILQVYKKYSQVSDDEDFAIFNHEEIVLSGKMQLYYTQFKKSSSSNSGVTHALLTPPSGSNPYENIMLGHVDSTVSGKKTFTTLPESSVVPTSDNQLVNKKYVDDNAGGGVSYTAGTNIEITNANVINNTIPYLNNEHGIAIVPNGSIGGYSGNITAIGKNSRASNYGATAFGYDTGANSRAVSIGANAGNYSTPDAISIGYNAKADQNEARFGSSYSNINKATIYTSNGLKELATTDFLTTITGYDATKTQILKNVQGTLTWVDEV